MFLGLQGVASTVAWACKCESDQDEAPADLLEDNERVFVGEVIRVPFGGRGCGSSEGLFTYTLVATEAFKGVEAGQEVDLQTPGDTCGMSMFKGESRLVYTDDDIVGGCSPGGLAADNAEAIEELRAAMEE